MRLIDADAFDKVLNEAQIKCKRNGGNFRYGVLNNVRANLAKAPTVSGWISVTDKEKLPKGECIAYSSKFDEMMIGYIGEAQGSDTGYCAENEGEFLYDVTHWMPKPKPPKE